MATEYVDWLYEYEETVKTQYPDEQQKVARDGLRVVLARVTGLDELPDSDPLRQAYRNLEAYELESQYERRDMGGESELWLLIRYNPDAIHKLIRSAGLPLWSSQRPRVLLIVSTIEGGQLTILVGESRNPIVLSARVSAHTRGLPISLPILDISELQILYQGSIAFGYLREIRQLRHRYGVDLVATAYVAPVELGFSRINMTLYEQEAVSRSTFDVPKPAQVGAAIVDSIVRHLTAQYAVPSTEQGTLRLVVGNVVSMEAFQGIFDYLEQWEFINDVVLKAFSGDELELALYTGTTWEQFSPFLLDDQLLVVTSDANQQFGNERHFVWRGSK